MAPVNPTVEFERQKALEESLFLDVPDDVGQPEDIEILRSPASFAAELMEHFSSDPNSKGGWLPFSGTHEFRIRPGELTVVAGANFAGKSAFLTQMMVNIVRPDNKFSDRDEKYLLISPEFSPKINLARLVVQIVGKLPKDITDQDVGAALAFLAKRMLILDVVGMVEADRVADIIHWCAQEHRITGTIIDNLTVMRLNGRGSGDNDATSDLMARLVEVARVTDTHIWLCAHTRKPSQGERVNRYQVRGASQITDLADNVITLERFELKEQKLGELEVEDRDEWEKAPDTFLHILKQRHGSAWTGRISLWFYKQSMRWCAERSIPQLPFEEIKDMVESTGGRQNDDYRSW